MNSPKTVFRNRMKRSGVAAWKKLAETTGRLPRDYVPTLLSARREEAGGRGVLLLKARRGAPDLILKFRVGDRKGAWVDRAVAAYTQAGKALAPQSDVQAPHVLACDAERQAILLSHVAGHPARELLFDADGGETDATARLLGQCAGWLSALHRAQPGPTVPFDPARVMPWAEAQADRDAYETQRAALVRLGERADGVRMDTGLVHGDMTLANLLVDRATVSGIDFEEDGPGPGVQDVAMLLADYLVWFGHDIPKTCRTPLPPALEVAFWRGYGAQMADDPVFRAHLVARLLTLWQNVPADPSLRSPRRAHVYAGVRAALARVNQDSP